MKAAIVTFSIKGALLGIKISEIIKQLSTIMQLQMIKLRIFVMIRLKTVGQPG